MPCIPSMSRAHIVFADPIELYGEGHYGLANVKEIRVTHSYLNMGTSITGCQNVESREKCNSRKFAEVVLSKCNCVPFGKVSFYGLHSLIDVSHNPINKDEGFLTHQTYFNTRSDGAVGLSRPVLPGHHWNMRTVCRCVRDCPSQTSTRTR